MALYGCHIWAKKVLKNKNLMKQLTNEQKEMALRVIRGYKRIATSAIFLLASTPPIETLIRVYDKYYGLTRSLKSSEVVNMEKEKARLKKERLLETILTWHEKLQLSNNRNQKVVKVILPCFDRWVTRSYGNLSYRMAQIISGHGCFGDYLCRIKKEPLPKCHHCNAVKDDNIHTAFICPAWSEERKRLYEITGRLSSLEGTIEAILHTPGKWEAFKAFCEAVMLKKEEHERAREAQRHREKLRGETLPPST
ncbi:uncharacterized protein LOC108627425 [Ceratina calcarata]|uniref:Uncharacterized protein LOC108627425 n=1 Tax=Ceratina calcarata TaxID=156304 RepID=A0AAJ7N9F0_9HYME|nr:uncharacterized protein LOC108627425 [Ceratina calcarata]